jgi:hypothetical protein
MLWISSMIAATVVLTFIFLIVWLIITIANDPSGLWVVAAWVALVILMRVLMEGSGLP